MTSLRVIAVVAVVAIVAGLGGTVRGAAAQAPTTDTTRRAPDTTSRIRGPGAPGAAPADSTRIRSGPTTPGAAPIGRVDSVGGTTFVVPALDQSRGLDAELRMALFDLSEERPLTALSRLEWLRSSPQALSGTATPGDHTRNDLLFLLAQNYYRLGMADEFRSVGQELLNAQPDGRYGQMIRSQLTLEAYKHGDYARVQDLSASAQGFGDRPLLSLVTGLAAYHRRDWAAAHAAFQASKTGGGPYAPYAQYMDALATLGSDSLPASGDVVKTDTAKVQAALAALKPLTTDTTAVADQARVTAAELSHELGRYDDAVQYASAVPATSGLASQALLTKAWALYRGGKLDSASAAFADFAKRYPQLPEREEARLMIGQLMLASKRPDLADPYFQAVADSIGNEVAAMQPGASGSMTDVSKALVSARLAGLAFVADPQSGKTLAVPDALGAHPSLLIAAFTNAPLPEATAAPAPTPLTLNDVQTRLAGLGSVTGGELEQRVLFTPASSPQVIAQYADKSQALHSADLASALAGYRLQEQLAGQTMKIFSLLTMQELLKAGDENIVATTRQGDAMRDSLVRMNAHLDSVKVRIRQSLYQQVRATQQLSAENQQKLDSTRTALGPVAAGADSGLLQTEMQTAAAYGKLADLIGGGVDSAIAHHPVFARRDSATSHLRQLRDVRDQAQAINTANTALVASELTAIQAAETERVRAQRSALAAAEQRRAMAETALVTLLENELRARSLGLVALLKQDRESADYGSASAAFFKALDTGASNTQPPASGANAIASPGNAATPTPPQR